MACAVLAENLVMDKDLIYTAAVRCLLDTIAVVALVVDSRATLALRLLAMVVDNRASLALLLVVRCMAPLWCRLSCADRHVPRRRVHGMRCVVVWLVFCLKHSPTDLTE